MQDLIYFLPKLFSIAFYMPLSTKRIGWKTLANRLDQGAGWSKDSEENPDFYPWIIGFFEHHPNPQLVRSIHFRLAPNVKPKHLWNVLGTKREKLSRILYAVNADGIGVTGTSKRR